MKSAIINVNTPNRISWLISLVTVGIGIFVVSIIIDPIWTSLKLHVPGEPNALVNYTQPVDSVFYVRNAEHGYSWGSSNPTSIWFHPFLVWAINILPSKISGNNRLWLISLFSGVVSLSLVSNLLHYSSAENVNPSFIFLSLIVPGGIGIATGNSEFTCLIFTACLLLSVVNKSNVLLPMLFGALAILMKPNAFYMIPVLAVYLIYGYFSNDRKLAINSSVGIGAIWLAFFAWLLFVDFKSQEFGAYWMARKIATVPLTSGAFSFLERSIRILLFVPDSGEKLKFATALFIPLVDMWLALLIPCKREVDRNAMIVGIGAIIVSTILLNNPNKVVTYVTTLPAHFIISILFIKESFKSSGDIFENIVRKLTGTIYVGYCALILMFFILGTPLGWYY